MLQATIISKTFKKPLSSVQVCPDFTEGFMGHSHCNLEIKMWICRHWLLKYPEPKIISFEPIGGFSKTSDNIP